jgi:uncharacterized protein (DUF433 family)
MTRIINDLMYDRGRGPELRSCRITVYDLIPYLEHPETYSDEAMLAVWPTVNRAELEALKEYIAEHREEVMAVHRKIEERIQRETEAQDTPEFRERMRQAHERVVKLQSFLAERKRLGLPSGSNWEETREAFHRWLEATQSRNGVHAP